MLFCGVVLCYSNLVQLFVNSEMLRLLGIHKLILFYYKISRVIGNFFFETVYNFITWCENIHVVYNVNAAWLNACIVV